MNCKAVILAGGKGTRMNSNLPKVLHKMCGIPLIEHVLRNTFEAGIKDVAVVVGHKHRMVSASVGGGVKYFLQKYQRGTADAVKRASAFFRKGTTPVLVLLGDAPLISAECIKNLYNYFIDNHYDMCVLSATLEEPAKYGRIVRSVQGDFSEIVEANEASEEQLKIGEINSGVMIFTPKALRYALKHITNNNSKKEYYLTDAAAILKANGKRVGAFDCQKPHVVLGANTPDDLLKCEQVYKEAFINNK